MRRSADPSPGGNLCERRDSAPLRGRFLRWVPDTLPLRCAPLQASGKGLLRGSRQSLHGFPGRMQRKRNATRDPAQDSAAKRRQTHFAEVSERERLACYSPQRSAAAAPAVPMTAAASDSAERIRNGVAKGTVPPSAAFAAE